MGTPYLLDSNIVIYLIKGTLSPEISEIIAESAKYPARLSVISKMEILGWNAPTPEEANAYLEFVEDSIIIPLTDDIVNKTIELRKSIRIKLPDAIIAATSLMHNFTLITVNESDFSRVPELNFINPMAKKT